jgi:ankyrin repeat protein
LNIFKKVFFVEAFFADETLALHRACAKGNVEDVKQLLGSGVGANNVDAAGNCPLHCVCFGVHENGCELANLLLVHGANINAVSDKGFSPLHIAAFSNNYNLCALLVRRHADLSIVSHSGFLASDMTTDVEVQKILLVVGIRAPSGLLQRRGSLPSSDLVSNSNTSSASISPVSRVRIPRDRSISSPFLKHK